MTSRPICEVERGGALPAAPASPGNSLAGSSSGAVVRERIATSPEVPYHGQIAEASGASLAALRPSRRRARRDPWARRCRRA